MRAAIVEYVPWLLSVLTLWMTYLAGKQHPRTWIVGIATQIGWTVWIVAVDARGLIPLNVGLWVLYIRNHILWRKTA